MGLFGSKNKDGSIGTNLSFVDGISTFFKGESVELSLYEDDNEIRIRSRINKSKSVVHLKLDKIIRAQFMSEKDIKEKSKSVGGRAIAGGLILGPLGAIIGGMSGIGSKKESITKYYIIINYKSNDKDKALSFEVVGASLGWDKVLKEINKHLIGEENTLQADIEL